jgi:hypothetical protein
MDDEDARPFCIRGIIPGQQPLHGHPARLVGNVFGHHFGCGKLEGSEEGKEGEEYFHSGGVSN